MDEAQVCALVGRPLPRRPAVLEGYERVLPAGGYPYVVPRDGATVAGLLLDDLDQRALAALDAYEDEGRLYVRRDAVAVAGGRRVPCQVYVGTGVTGAPGRA
jgi:gamma-glutamylcyclotransferase (GGCT)/AIG2-like uncharacterized protein YtfP